MSEYLLYISYFLDHVQAQRRHRTRCAWHVHFVFGEEAPALR